MEETMRQSPGRQHYFMLLTMLFLAGCAALFARQGILARGASGEHTSPGQRQAAVAGGSYLYYAV